MLTLTAEKPDWSSCNGCTTPEQPIKVIQSDNPSRRTSISWCARCLRELHVLLQEGVTE